MAPKMGRSKKALTTEETVRQLESFVDEITQQLDTYKHQKERHSSLERRPSAQADSKELSEKILENYMQIGYLKYGWLSECLNRLRTLNKKFAPPKNCTVDAYHEYIQTDYQIFELQNAILDAEAALARMRKKAESVETETAALKESENAFNQAWRERVASQGRRRSSVPSLHGIPLLRLKDVLVQRLASKDTSEHKLLNELLRNASKSFEVRKIAEYVNIFYSRCEGLNTASSSRLGEPCEFIEALAAYINKERGGIYDESILEQELEQHIFPQIYKWAMKNVDQME
eukprot:Colp12_sorted_trinity150504_noHs@10958